ncbi:type II toxin-antitoxin system VapB family antitoxin [Trinickia diaoshuihuensis]|uniref:type II toxin-antitoxin system VapB family antitoxin n=1 Tax=Trinickia diaoshuihuensis TaxID=2292265 RepID=UPI000E260751|nr:type II toxin-antitoxin system VapB family antitoxin [Trinickia diaoshuihuensis]
MRTNIDIDDRLMSDALAASGLKTKREVVELGLQKIIQLKRQEELRQLRGKIDWQGNLDEMRRD